jgi:hypothetical protein
MRVLKKLICRKVKGDDEDDDDGLILKHHDHDNDSTQSDDSSTTPKFLQFVAFSSKEESQPQQKQEEEQEDIYNVMEHQLGNLDVPAHWVIDYKILGLHERGVAIKDDDSLVAEEDEIIVDDDAADDETVASHIVEQVRKSLRQKRRKSKHSMKQQRGGQEQEKQPQEIQYQQQDEEEEDEFQKSRSCLSLPKFQRISPPPPTDYAGESLLSVFRQDEAKLDNAAFEELISTSRDDDPHQHQVANMMIRNLQQAHHWSAEVTDEKVIKPKSLLRHNKSATTTTPRKTTTTPARGKKARFSDTLEAQYTVPTQQRYTTSSKQSKKKKKATKSLPGTCGGVIRSPVTRSYYCGNADNIIDDDSDDLNSLIDSVDLQTYITRGISIDRSMDEDHSSVLSDDQSVGTMDQSVGTMDQSVGTMDQSVGTMELFFHHMTCSPQDRLRASD